MNKNECKTCKNYVQAWIDVSGEHGDCTLYPTWLDVPAAHYCGQWITANATSEEIPALDIDWSQVPEGYDWAAQDQNGLVWACEIEPKCGEDQWLLGEINSRLTRFHHHIPLCPNPDWRNTLTKRPGTN